MRQVGKTTLLEYLFHQVKSENKAILDAGNPLHRKIFEEENYDNVLNNLLEYNITPKQKIFLFVDEVQNLPSITRVVKYLYDHYNVKFFLTGSSSFYLKNLFSESLAGRKIIFELFPLSFQEFLTFKRIKRRKIYKAFAKKAQRKNKISFEIYKKYYQEYVRYGGFPKVVLAKDSKEKRQFLSEIFTSYFEIDVKSLADFKEMSKARDLILLLTARIGSKLDITKLSSELGVSRETIYSYLSFLEQTYFISLLARYSKSYDRKAAGSKKLYFCDTGLANFLGSLAQGQLLENSVYQNLRIDYKLTYFSKKSGGEIDFIVDGGAALEVKNTASRKDIFNLMKTAKSLGAEEMFVVSLQYSNSDKVILAQDL